MSRRREILGNIKGVKRRTKQFIVPMLEIPLMHVSKGKSYVIDVCVTTVGYPQVVYIFDNIDNEPLKMDIYRLQNHHDFVSIDYGDSEREVLVFMNIPLEYRHDFDTFVKGKYTRFSEKYKKLLIEKYSEDRHTGFNKVDGLPNLSMKDVIDPEDDTRMRLARSLSSPGSIVSWRELIEVLDAPDMKYETFRTVEELEEEYGIK